MSKVYLAPDQYVMYDEDGTVLGRRSVKVYTLSDKSEQGPGICAVLRTGMEINTGDGVGVSLSITDDQLAELGYIPKPAVKSDEPVNFLAFLGVSQEELDEALKRSNLAGHVHFTPTYRCAFEDTLVEAVNKIRAEKARYAYCLECKEMVDPFVGFNGKRYDRVMHDFNLEIYCAPLQRWIPAYEDGKAIHTVDMACVEKNPPAHPKVVEGIVSAGVDADEAESMVAGW